MAGYCISTTQMVNLGVNEFHPMRRIWWRRVFHVNMPEKEIEFHFDFFGLVDFDFIR